MSEKAHYDSVVSYMRGTRAAYTRSISRITGIWEGYPINRDVPFNIDNYPSLKKKVDAEVRRLAMNLETNIVNGVNEEWARSNFKNDQFVDMVFRNRNVPPAVMEAMKNRNMEALAGFKARTVGGMGLSDRIWVNSDKVRNEIQQAMAVGIHEGRPAADLARDMQEFLNRPDDMFRRVRDAEGNLRLSEAAKNFHPGKGVYRSSYKNAMRMTRTEINGSYRMADNTRWNQLEFILGYEIHRSQNIKADCDICDANQGKYPKDYVFVGWHPHCMCYMTSILPSEEKMDEYMDNLWDGKETQFDYINQPDIKGGLGTFDWRSQTGRQKNVYEMLATNKDTQEMYKGPDGNYTPTRQQLHNDIIKRFDDMGSTYDDQVYMLGGAPANGKSTLVDSGFLKHPAKTMMIDPDKIKGMIPEYNMMISSRDPIVRKLAAAKLHEESSYLSKIIQKNALASKKDFILDGVNDGKVEKVIGKLQAMKAQGKTIRADYCTLDTNLSLRLAEKRGRKTGRVVPTQHVANTNRDVSVMFPELSKANVVDELRLWDTNRVGQARLVFSNIKGKVTIHDQDLWERFLIKGKLSPQQMKEYKAMGAPVPQVKGFVPAKSVRDAERFALQYAEKVDYSNATLEQANELNRTLMEVSRGRKVGEIKFLEKINGSSRFDYPDIHISPLTTVGNTEVVAAVNPRHLRTIKRLEAQQKSGTGLNSDELRLLNNTKKRVENATRWSAVNGSVRDTLIHEYGHKLDFMQKKLGEAASASYKHRQYLWDNIPGTRWGEKSDWISKNISDYAVDRTFTEFVAEVYVMKMKGERLPGWLDEFITNLINNAI